MDEVMYFKIEYLQTKIATNLQLINYRCPN